MVHKPILYVVIATCGLVLLTGLMDGEPARASARFSRPEENRQAEVRYLQTTPSPEALEPTARPTEIDQEAATQTARVELQMEARRNNMGLIACAAILVAIVMGALLIYAPRRG